MDKIQVDFSFVAVNVDDMQIFSELLSEHGLHVAEVILRLNKWSKHIRSDKSRSG